MPQGSKKLSIPFVVAFYSFVGAVAYGLGFWLAERNIFLWHDSFETTLQLDVLLGAGFGIVVVGVSRAIEFFEWARQLAAAMKTLLGELSTQAILVIALCSSLGEEMLFRGLLQPAIGIVWSSLIFGLLHVGPDRRYAPWTLMAIGMGCAFGGLHYYTGNLLAPILAHFTINHFNLTAIAKGSSRA